MMIKYNLYLVGEKPVSLTEFEKAVLRAICRIPIGQTRSYKWVARQIGKPKASRAVGQALKRNPFAPLVPCHRVVRSTGDIGGYGQGVKNKIILLEAEKKILGLIRRKKC